MICVQIPLEVIDAQFICIFKFAIVLVAYLHRVIRQVNAPVEICEIKRLWGGAQVTVSVHETFQETVCWGKHGECSHIELTTTDE